jgi:hypothetical protein
LNRSSSTKSGGLKQGAVPSTLYLSTMSFRPLDRKCAFGSRPHAGDGPEFHPKTCKIISASARVTGRWPIRRAFRRVIEDHLLVGSRPIARASSGIGLTQAKVVRDHCVSIPLRGHTPLNHMGIPSDVTSRNPAPREQRFATLHQMHPLNALKLQPPNACVRMPQGIP